MFAVGLTAEWAAWVAALMAPLHRRCAWRLAHVVLGILLAAGRRTVASWWRAARIGESFGSYYYFLGSVGRKATEVATVVFGLLRERIDSSSRLLLAIDDTPTKRYGPKVQGAGVHHNPTPGPAGSKFLYGDQDKTGATRPPPRPARNRSSFRGTSPGTSPAGPRSGPASELAAADEPHVRSSASAAS